MGVLGGRILLRPGGLDRSRRFCGDLLGLAVCREFGPPDDPGVVFFPGPGAPGVFGQAAGPPGRSVIIGIRVRDVHAGPAGWPRPESRLRGSRLPGPGARTEMQLGDPGGTRIFLVGVPAGHPLRRDPRAAVRPGRGPDAA